MSHPYAHHVARAKSFARLMDSAFKVGGVPVGLDPIFSLIPGIGAIVPALLSIYIIWIGIRIGVTPAGLVVMGLNILLDMIISAVPILGFFGDTIFRSNIRNIRILETHLEK